MPHICAGLSRGSCKAWGAWVVRPVSGAGRGLMGGGRAAVEGPGWGVSAEPEQE